MIAALRQRIADFLRERRIARLRAVATAALQRHGRMSLAKDEVQALIDECSRRSPGQIARMKRRLGLSPRTALKRSLIDAHCNGVIPAFAVRAAFRVFRLRSH